MNEQLPSETKSGCACGKPKNHCDPCSTEQRPKETKSRHTPGPWVVNDFCTEGGADTAVWTSHDPHTAKSICECHFNTVREIQRGEHGCHQIEAEANARLIAAAPELLEALMSMVSGATANEAFVTGHGENPRLSRARQAIKKATQS